MACAINFMSTGIPRLIKHLVSLQITHIHSILVAMEDYLFLSIVILFGHCVELLIFHGVRRKLFTMPVVLTMTCFQNLITPIILIPITIMHSNRWLLT